VVCVHVDPDPYRSDTDPQVEDSAILVPYFINTIVFGWNLEWYGTLAVFFD
jgi:hypothetical protein